MLYRSNMQDSTPSSENWYLKHENGQIHIWTGERLLKIKRNGLSNTEILPGPVEDIKVNVELASTTI